MPRKKPLRPIPIHALINYQSVLDFANTKPLDESNYLTRLGAGVISEKIIETSATLAGRPQIGLGAALQLQGCVQEAMARFLDGNKYPLQISHFNIAGREPYGFVKRKEPVAIYVGWDQVTPAVNDLQDFWFLRVSDLIHSHKRIAALSSYNRRAPFWQLARCEAPACGRFYFRKRKGDRTCRRTCAQALDHQTHKNKRRPPARPRSRITIPPPRAKD